MNGPLDIELRPLGVADVLRQYRLQVPPNQRSYDWREEHINQLFDDWADAFSSRTQGHYFLGTIVLNRTPSGALEVSDGQQRLATTAIFIAAIRDVIAAGDDQQKIVAMNYTNDFLIRFEEMEGDWLPKLRLNTADNQFFREAILIPPGRRAETRIVADRRGSNERLARAYELAKRRIGTLMESVSKEYRIRHLYEWKDFVMNKVVVIVIIAPSDVDAFTMFETLNDRGLKASQVDNIKNRLFREAGARISDVEDRWLSMAAQIESFGNDKTIIDYLRHYWISEHGPTREQDLAKQFREKIGGQAQVATLVQQLDDHVADYDSLFFSPLEHQKLNDLTPIARRYIAATTCILGIEQIRPLMLAIRRRFEGREAEKAFCLMLFWSIRFLIVGTGGGGFLDRHYGLAAAKVSTWIPQIERPWAALRP